MVVRTVMGCSPVWWPDSNVRCGRWFHAAQDSDGPLAYPGLSTGGGRPGHTLPPALQITISDIASRTYGLTLYPQPKTSEWTIARKEDGEPVLFQSRRVEEILKKKSYFLPK